MAMMMVWRKKRRPVERPFPTPAQERVMGALVGWIDEHGQAPTVRELCAVLGFSSTRTLTDHLVALERGAAIRREPRRRRNIHVVEPELWRVEGELPAA